MTVTRRSFLRSGALTVLVTGIALDSVSLAFAQQLRRFDPSQDFLASFESKQEPTFNFRRETFEPYVNGVFTLGAGAGSVEATLVRVEDCSPDDTKSRKVTKRWRLSAGFMLVFQAREKLTDLTSIYDVEHGALGKFRLFLTHRDGPDGGYFYEAVFNHTL
ncbi:MAG TPA: hypothetical protein VN282_28215 [Pyrinomonadaceae bacterium]|nr:hypothetical protein [Pyrinomonadaceae bacterium]